MPTIYHRAFLMVGTLRFALRISQQRNHLATAACDPARRSLRSGFSSPSRSLDGRTMTLLPIPANPAPEGDTNALPQAMGNARFKPS